MELFLLHNIKIHSCTHLTLLFPLSIFHSSSSPPLLPSSFLFFPTQSAFLISYLPLLFFILFEVTGFLFTDNSHGHQNPVCPCSTASRRGARGGTRDWKAYRGMEAGEGKWWIGGLGWRSTYVQVLPVSIFILFCLLYNICLWSLSYYLEYIRREHREA